MAFTIKQGDTSPAILATLDDADGNAVDITGASVRLHLRSYGSAQTYLDVAATIVTPASGLVRYQWSEGDTDTPGVYEAEFEVTYDGGAVETFPNANYRIIEIVRQIA